MIPGRYPLISAGYPPGIMRKKKSEKKGGEAFPENEAPHRSGHFAF
jgi:hypothetical protein